MTAAILPENLIRNPINFDHPPEHIALAHTNPAHFHNRIDPVVIAAAAPFAIVTLDYHLVFLSRFVDSEASPSFAF